MFTENLVLDIYSPTLTNMDTLEWIGAICLLIDTIVKLTKLFKKSRSVIES